MARTPSNHLHAFDAEGLPPEAEAADAEETAEADEPRSECEWR